MLRKKSIARRMNRIVASSSSNDSNDHELLGVDQEQTPQTQASTHDTSSTSTILSGRGGSFHSEIHLPGSIKLSRRTTF